MGVVLIFIVIGTVGTVLGILINGLPLPLQLVVDKIAILGLVSRCYTRGMFLDLCPVGVLIHSDLEYRYISIVESYTRLHIAMPERYPILSENINLYVLLHTWHHWTNSPVYSARNILELNLNSIRYVVNNKQNCL